MKIRFNRINAVNVTVWRSFCLRVGAAMAAVCVCAALLTAQSGGITTKDAKAKEAVDAAIKAIGGSGKIGDIKSLVIKGTRNPAPNVRASGLGMEIRILLPDNFIQIHQLDMGGPWHEGVSQGTLIPPRNTNISPYLLDGSLAPPEQIEAFAKRLAIRINDDTSNAIDGWSRFLIGTLMKAGATPITISSGSTSGIFNLTKNDGTLGEIEFDPKTGYPSVIRYKNPEYPIPNVALFGKQTPKVKPGGGVEIDTAGAITSDDTGGGEIRFQDHFSVNGIMFPKVIVLLYSTPIDPIIELRIEEVQINPKLSLKDFEVPQR